MRSFRMLLLACTLLTPTAVFAAAGGPGGGGLGASGSGSGSSSGGGSKGPGFMFWYTFATIADKPVAALITSRCEDRELDGVSLVGPVDSIKALASCARYARTHPKQYAANMRRPFAKHPRDWTAKEQKLFADRATASGG